MTTTEYAGLSWVAKKSKPMAGVVMPGDRTTVGRFPEYSRPGYRSVWMPPAPVGTQQLVAGEDANCAAIAAEMARVSNESSLRATVFTVSTHS